MCHPRPDSRSVLVLGCVWPARDRTLSPPLALNDDPPGACHTPSLGWGKVSSPREAGMGSATSTDAGDACRSGAAGQPGNGIEPPEASELWRYVSSLGPGTSAGAISAKIGVRRETPGRGRFREGRGPLGRWLANTTATLVSLYHVVTRSAAPSTCQPWGAAERITWNLPRIRHTQQRRPAALYRKPLRSAGSNVCSILTSRIRGVASVLGWAIARTTQAHRGTQVRQDARVPRCPSLIGGSLER